MKKNSWTYVLLNPTRWWELLKYLTAPPPSLGACDRPDPRDLSAPKLKGTVRMPRKFSLLEKSKKLGWEIAKQSKNSCTAYSKGHGVEVINTIEHQKPICIDKERQWEYQLKTGGSIARGDSIQNAEKQFHNNPQGFPQTEYRRLRGENDTVFGIKRWLLRIETIRTGIYWKWVSGMGMTNDEYMQTTGFFIPGDGRALGGHAVFISGWDDDKEAFEVVESEKIKWGDNEEGVFWVKYEHIHHLFSKYISRDTIDK